MIFVPGRFHGVALADYAFNYSIEADLRWTDSLSRPTGSEQKKDLTAPATNAGSLTEEEYQAEPTRAPGLTLLRLEGSWSLRKQSQLQFTLRPDALLLRGNKTHEPTSYDTRAGVVYKALPPTELLESYQIKSFMSPTIYWSLGVFPYLSAPVRSYPDLLAFAPLVHLPRNLFALRLNWQKPVPRQHSAGRNWGLGISIYQGPGDRSEKISPQKSSFDSAPGGIDPYHGAAMKVSYYQSKNWFATLFLAYHEAGSSGAKERSLYLDSSFRYTFMAGPWLTDQSLNLRYNRDSWEITNVSATPLSQFSFAVTNHVNLSDKQKLLLGLSIGRSEFHPEVSTSEKLVYFGHQLEIGLQYEFHKGFDTYLLIAEEHREKINLEDKIEPGFQNDQEQRKMLRRVAVGISYILKG